MIAQKLYEAGHITYMRTDSLNLSQLAINSISNLITDELGEKYLKVRRYHTNAKGAQEAHEAIRPTYIDKETIDGSAQENASTGSYASAQWPRRWLTQNSKKRQST